MTNKTDVLHHSEATRLLAEKIGRDQVRTDELTRFSASYDNVRISFMPDAVIFPLTEADIAFTLQLANRHLVPVTVRGAGTGGAGAALPIRRGWVVNLSHWKGMQINPHAATASVQPGVSIKDINDEAAKYGLLYPPNPSSMAYSTIGGNLATNASGPRTAKYGACRDYVYSLEGFLPTGKFVSWGRPLRKYSSGYDIKDLWIGSGGTLGIITKAVLKLIPRPAQTRTFVIAFDSDQEAFEAVAALLSTHFQPSALEFSDAWTINRLRRQQGCDNLPDILKETDASIVLLETDGHPAVVADDAKYVRDWAGRYSRDSHEIINKGEMDRIWTLFGSRSQTASKSSQYTLSEEVAIPREGYMEFMNFFHDIKREANLSMGMSCDAADGVFCLNAVFDHQKTAPRKAAEEVLFKIISKAVKMGGAITGRFGIGVAKSPFLGFQHTEAEISTMISIRQALDPNDILGSGQIFSSTNLWDYQIMDMSLPWD